MSTATPSAATSILEQFKWEPQPEAERLVDALLQPFLKQSPRLEKFAARLRSEAGVRLHDIVDSIGVPFSDALDRQIESARYYRSDSDEMHHEYRHADGIFPTIVLDNFDGEKYLSLKVDSVVEFCAIHGLDNINGLPLGPERVAAWLTDGNSNVLAVERHGSHGNQMTWPRDNPAVPLAPISALEQFRIRRRLFDNPDDGFTHAAGLIDAAIKTVGIHRACDLFFAAEREYWQRRNRAAQVQKARQDRLGIGWANHDHHTYRSSRRHFSRLIAIWEKLGFVCRERFYAGKEAGWGAQVMEQPNAGIVTFNDVDLSPDELLIDFAHEPLPERKELGTVGLWCALHGESFLEAGMHHLECMFDFNALKEQLERDHNVGVMKPFTDFPYLKQAFTVGERWPVREERIAVLLSKGQITAEQAEKFRTEGAIGSHLENLERNQGFKGFNQTGVSEIIAATDPRKHLR
jgi:hypothetical protein